MIPQINTPESLTIFFENRPHTIRKTDAKYADIVALVEAEDIDGLRLSLGLSTSLPAYSNGAISVVDGEVKYNGKPLHNAVTTRIVGLLKAGKKFDYILNFLKRVLENPSKFAVDELYLFLEKGQIPITSDGHFLAYRKVDSNYKSFHGNPDGTYNTNKVGDIVTMERQKVDPNRNNTCSTGLHFCSFGYLNQYHGGQGKVMIVKIDPADVVSIPSDYNNTKGRTCKYIVVAEHNFGERQEAYKDVVLANPDGSAHEGQDIDKQQKKTAKASPKLNELEKRVGAYIERKRDKGALPSLRQIQSSLSPLVPTIDKLKKIVEKLGYKVEADKKSGKPVVR